MKIWHTFRMFQHFPPKADPSNRGKLRANIAIVLIFAFLGASVSIPETKAGEVVVPVMPAPGNMVSLSSSYIPAHLMGMTIHPDNALKFDFLIHKGDGKLTQDQKKEEYTKLVKYFLASLTIPDKDQWVNLSPYEKNRIIESNFGKTEMGRDLLGQDYLLKQITSSLMYPESGLGRNFWDKVYAEAYKKYGGSTSLTINTFNKVWIVPDKATVYESKNTAYIIQSHLKVMLEEDYVALSKNTVGAGPRACPTCPGQPQGVAPTKAIIREIILPAIEREVNEGKNFAQLRQIVSGMILATWYKKSLKESLLSKIYADKAKVSALGGSASGGKGTQNDIELIYQQYLKAFKKGVYNYIKEDPSTSSGQAPVVRKYFAGGFEHPVVHAYSQGMLTPELITVVRNAFTNAAQMADQAIFVMLPTMESKPTWDRNKFIVSLESVGVPRAMHARLLQDAVDQVVVTDIPLSGRLIQWVSRKNWALKGFINAYKEPQRLKASELNQSIVLTVANNARWWSTIKKRIGQSVAESMGGIFIVSGGGVFQRFFSWVPSYLGGPIKSSESIPYAARSKDEYQNLYVAWNPNDAKDTVERLHKKINNGAKAVVTQPPFVWGHFEKSINRFKTRNPDIPVIVGVPVFSSAKNVRLWMKLIGLDWWNNPEARKLVWDAEYAENVGNFAPFRTEWTVKLIKKIQTEIPASGIHLMPMGAPERVIYDILRQTNLLKETKTVGKVDAQSGSAAMLGTRRFFGIGAVSLVAGRSQRSLGNQATDKNRIVLRGNTHEDPENTMEFEKFKQYDVNMMALFKGFIPKDLIIGLPYGEEILRGLVEQGVFERNDALMDLYVKEGVVLEKINLGFIENNDIRNILQYLLGQMIRHKSFIKSFQETIIEQQKDIQAIKDEIRKRPNEILTIAIELEKEAEQILAPQKDLLREEFKEIASWVSDNPGFYKRLLLWRYGPVIFLKYWAEDAETSSRIKYVGVEDQETLIKGNELIFKIGAIGDEVNVLLRKFNQQDRVKILNILKPVLNKSVDRLEVVDNDDLNVLNDLIFADEFRTKLIELFDARNEFSNNFQKRNTQVAGNIIAELGVTRNVFLLIGSKHIDDIEKLLHEKLGDSVEIIKSDRAMFIYLRRVVNKGGIDMNSANLAMTIKRDASASLSTGGNGVPLPLVQQDLAQLSQIEGFEPHILEIKPAINLSIIRELNGH